LQQWQDRAIILYQLFCGRSAHHATGNDDGEVSLKELKDIVLLLAKQMVDLKAAMSQREEIASRSSEYPLGHLPGSETKSGAGRELVGGITPFQPFREARQQAEDEWSVRS